MPLQTNTFKQNLKSLFQEMRTKEEVSDDYFAERFSNLVEKYIKTGTVTTVVTTPEGGGTGTGNIT